MMRPMDVPVSVIGDGAPAVANLLADAGASGEVVLLRRWQSLEHVPDLRRLCRRACDGAAPIVALRQPTWDGLRRVTVVDVGALGGGAALDAGKPLPPEVSTRVAAAAAGEGARRTAWRLPFGL